jgi:CheY-like chemotaxis protein
LSDQTCTAWHDILVIDDEAPIREAIADILTDAGYIVRCAANGTEAFMTLLMQRPALVLLDVMMPVLEGEAVSAAIRRYDPTLPIVLISASPSRATALMQSGQAERFIAKPFDIDDLLVCVQRFVPPAKT